MEEETIKFNKLIIIGIFILAIFIISAVSAEDCTSDLLSSDNAVETVSEDELSVENEFTIGNSLSDENLFSDEKIPLEDDDNQIKYKIPLNDDDNQIEDNSQSEIINNINISFKEQMWKENLSDINVSLPENAEGIFALKLNHVLIYNESITNKTFQIPVNLSSMPIPIYIVNIWPPYDYDAYTLTAFYNDIEINISQKLKVMTYSPDYEFWWGIGEEVLQYSPQFSRITIPRSANGYIELYLDGNLINKTNVTGPYFVYDSDLISNSSLGTHTLNYIYTNDTYYSSRNRTISFEVVNVKIDVPKNIEIGHDDCVSVDVLQNTSGYVKIYIDGVLACSGNTEYGEYLVSLADYLKYNSSEVKVVFTGKDYNRTKTVRIAVNYDIDIYGSTTYVYGEDNSIELMLPDNLNNSLLTVTVDGIRFTPVHDSYIMNNLLDVNISTLGGGNHTLYVYYPGDDMFISKNATYDFEVIYRGYIPFEITYEEGRFVYLNLPADANGNLTVFVDDEFYITKKLFNGYAAIDVSNLAPNEYFINITYTGDDYEVSPRTSLLFVEPKVITDYRFTQGQDRYITVIASNTTEGYVLFTVDEKVYNITVKDGLARFSLKNLTVGEHDVDIEFITGDYKTFAWKTVTVYKPKINVISSDLYTDRLYMKVKVTDYQNKIIKKAPVTVKINGKTVKTFTDSKGFATVSIPLSLKAKKYKVSVSSGSARVSKTLTAKHVVSLKAVNIRKSSKSLVLTAVLKNKKAIKSKVVTFRFNGKTFRAKTNSKGIAKLTVPVFLFKTLKIGKKVTCQATYLKDTVKRTAVVKK